MIICWERKKITRVKAKQIKRGQDFQFWNVLKLIRVSFHKYFKTVREFQQFFLLFFVFNLIFQRFFKMSLWHVHALWVALRCFLQIIRKLIKNKKGLKSTKILFSSKNSIDVRPNLLNTLQYWNARQHITTTGNEA